jgi:kynurenine formamidase
MEAEVKLDGQRFRVDLTDGKSIARTIYVAATKATLDIGAIAVQSKTYRDGDFVGDMSVGGACNVSVLKINPHCCGTHTETLMHVMPTETSAALPTIDMVAPKGLQLSLVLTLKTCSLPEARACDERFTEHAGSDDRLVSAAALRAALAGAAQCMPRGYAAWDSAKKESLGKSLVIRIAEDDPATVTSPWSFGSDVPPYFTSNAIELLNEQSVEHLLVEFPSIDRLDDGGRLTNHHKFWNIDQESKNLVEAWPSKTITEMIEISSSIDDGLYLLSIQAPPVRTDAMLSRPVLFQLFE